MKREKYIKKVLEKLNADGTVTCEDCGNKDMIGHAIVDHHGGTVAVVCHVCFVAKYQDGLYVGTSREAGDNG